MRTYINSGNVVFDSGKDEVAIRRALQAELTAFAGRAIGVVVRSPQQMAAVLDRNPFAELPPNKTVVIFLDAAPKRAALLDVSGRRDEELRLGKREIYVYYPSGQGRSKLKISAASDGTARNMNTVASLAQLAGAG